MKPGPFAKCGLVRCGGESLAKPFHTAMSEAVAGICDVTDPHVAGTLYARSCAFGAARATIRHAEEQRHPSTAVEMLPALERRYEVTPAPGASMKARRDAVSAKKLLSRGPRRESLEAILRTLLGDAFIAIRPTPDAERTVWPADFASIGAWSDPAAPARVFRLTRNCAGVGAAGYAPLLGTSDRLFVGDRVAVQIENNALAEAVTVTSVDHSDPSNLRFSASFAHVHDVGASVSTHAPVATSNQRHMIIVLTPTAARDPETRRKVAEAMGRVLNAVTTWAIAESADGATIPALTLGAPGFGTMALGASAVTI